MVATCFLFVDCNFYVITTPLYTKQYLLALEIDLLIKSYRSKKFTTYVVEKVTRLNILMFVNNLLVSV